MKYVLSLIALFLLVSFRQADGIYNIAIRNIDGNIIELSQYKGKKLLFIVLPLSAQDTTVSINDIAQLQTKYQSSLIVIGIPSVEAGYKTQDAHKFKKLYNDASANFIIAEGMKVKKGTEQSSLFQWLTTKDMNQHFDQNVQGVGTKFFVNEAGRLYAVLSPRTSLQSPIVDRIVQVNPSKAN